MNNRGSVTVFLCLMIIAMVLLAMEGKRVVEHHMAKSKGAMTTKSAMSGIDAGYNSYIFENYHILLFDKNFNGQGEGALEQQLIDDIQYNLGSSFVVEDAVVVDYQLIIEDDCRALKSQITDFCKYGLVGRGADAILQSTEGKDGTVADYIKEDMDAAKNSQNEEGQQDEQLADGEDEADQPKKTKDPRAFTRNITSDGILSLVVPEDMEINSEEIDISQVPSREKLKYSLLDFEVDNNFDDMDVLKKDIGELDSWKDELVEAGAGVMYAEEVFNCATDKVIEDTVFELELEYLIVGMASDRENLKGVVNRIIGVRFPVNYTYLLSDPEKISEITKIAVPLSFATLIPAPVLKYLLAGCWAYVESIFDVRCLLEGQKIEFFKDAKSWKTDIHDLENSVYNQGEESKQGLCYKDYLLILLSLDMGDGYYRMLDIIQLNTRQYYENFNMSNGAVGFTLDTTITYQDKQFCYRESISY